MRNRQTLIRPRQMPWRHLMMQQKQRDSCISFEVTNKPSDEKGEAREKSDAGKPEREHKHIFLTE